MNAQMTNINYHIILEGFVMNDVLHSFFFVLFIYLCFG